MYHNWKPEEVTNLYTRIIAAENRLLNIEGRMDKNGKTDLEKILQKHEEWLAICDKSIKELRVQLNIITNAKLSVIKPVEIKTPKKWWKF